MSATTLVRRFVFNLSRDEIFTTRDCLNFGRRNAVDQALFRLVKTGVITRIARGVFVRAEFDLKALELKQIARVKAKAFFRRIYSDAENAFLKLKPKLSPDARQPAERSFVTDGARTSFESIQGRVYLQKVAPRKLFLDDKTHGLVIRALWSLGIEGITAKTIQETCVTLNRTDMQSLRKSCAVMPAWLADRIAFPLSTARSR